MKDRIPVNVWDDYWDDDSGKPQETHAYVEDEDIPERSQHRMLKAVCDFMATLDLNGVSVSLVGPRIYFAGLTHARRERLVEELQEARLEFKGVPFHFYSES